MTKIGLNEKVFLMKQFLTMFILIFSFQSWAKANDIRDFEIEGLSVGDSLLKYFDKEFIDENKSFNYDSTEMYSLYLTLNLKTFEEIEINFKNNDDDYIIQAIAGIEVIDIKKCLKKKKVITKELKSLFNFDPENYVHKYNNDYLTAGLDLVVTSESRAHITEWDFPNNDKVRVWCSEWGKDVKSKLNWYNELHIKIQNAAWMEFIRKQ